MRTIVLPLLAVVALPLSGADAHAAPWCANYGTGSGTNCGFYSIEQCRAALSGVGSGYCAANPLDTSTDTRRRNSRN